MHRISMLGTGLIGMFYTMALHGQWGRDRVSVVYSRSAERAKAFAEKWETPRHTTSLKEAIEGTESDVVVVALPNYQHEEAVLAAAAAGKAVLCTKPLGRNAAESQRMLEACEKAGVFHGYLEGLVYPLTALTTLKSVKSGSVAITRIQDPMPLTPPQRHQHFKPQRLSYRPRQDRCHIWQNSGLVVFSYTSASA